MSEEGIIDIFEPEGDRAFTFASDNAVAKKGLTLPAAAIDYLDTGDSLTTNERFFAPQDSFTIVSMGVRIPYCYNLADDHILFRLLWTNAAATFVQDVNEISNTGRLFIPLPDEEVPLDIYARFPNRVPNEKLQLTYELSMQISQINAPAILQTVVIPVFPFVKIRHTLPLVP